MSAKILTTVYIDYSQPSSLGQWEIFCCSCTKISLESSLIVNFNEIKHRTFMIEVCVELSLSKVWKERKSVSWHLTRCGLRWIHLIIVSSCTRLLIMRFVVTLVANVNFLRIEKNWVKQGWYVVFAFDLHRRSFWHVVSGVRQPHRCYEKSWLVCLHLCVVFLKLVVDHLGPFRITQC